MQLIDYANQSFHQNIDNTRDAMVKMLDPMMQACDVLTRCFVNGNKLICSGAGAAGLTAEYMTTILTGGMEIPRPALPALSLTDSQRVNSVLTADLGNAQAFVTQLNALGQQGDVLFVISNRHHLSSMTSMVVAARERDMVVVALSAQDDQQLITSLRDTDTCIPCGGDNHMRTHELQTLAVHGLCDLVDRKLMGPV